MKLKQGAILWINLDPAKGTETKKATVFSCKQRSL